MIKNPDRLKFIHMTDCHIAGSSSSVFGNRPTERLRAAIDSINMDHANADFVVITGDLARHGDHDAYGTLARELRRLSIPAHLLMGNHDDKRAFVFQFPDVQRCENGFVQGSKRTPFGLCLFLDTSSKGSLRGQYCALRQGWLANVLSETDGPVMLFMHHPPFRTGMTDADDSCLEDAASFWRILEPHRPRIRHIFVGHAHQAMFGNWHGISVSGMRGLAHQFQPDGEQITLDHGYGSGHGKRPMTDAPAYGIVLADAEQVVVHLHHGSVPSRSIA